MTRRPHQWGWFAAATLVSAVAFGQPQGEPVPLPAHQSAQPGEAQPASPNRAALHAAAQEPARDLNAHGDSNAEHAGHDSSHATEHQSGHHDEHAPPTFDDINWYYGFLAESDSEPPSVLYRPKGMAPPFLASLINWGIFVVLLGMLAKKQVPAALAKRKASIVQGMEESKKLRDESAARLREYEDKLAKIDTDIERIKEEMRKAGEQERDRILAEAVERRTRMERDARRLIETELEAAKELLRRELVHSSLASAKKSIEAEVQTTDQQRLFDEAIASLRKLPARSLGGRV